MPLPQIIVDEAGCGQLTGDGVPLVRALLGTQQHIAGQVLFLIGIPLQQHAGHLWCCCQTFRCSRCVLFTLGIEGEDTPQLTVRILHLVPLADVDTIAYIGVTRQ